MIPILSMCAVAIAFSSAAERVELEPARFLSGSVPQLSPLTLGGGEVLLEVDVDSTGRVTNITTLRSTPPFSDALGAAVSGWRFSPAQELSRETETWAPVDSKVLVAGLFRPPTIYDAPARGEIPEDVTSPSREVPFPTSLIAPPFPPTTYMYVGETVLVEVEVGEDGAVTESKVLRSMGNLDDAAKAAAEQWRFRPALRDGEPAASAAYIVFGFREPVVSRR